ncbi:uncharacterized protein METZ01_LOCUS465093, partial [marine metagenome]
GPIPSEIMNLSSLKYLYFNNNQLSGEITQNICELSNIDDFIFNNNQLCPPYPECLNPDDVGIQNLDNCNEVVIECEDGYIGINYFCYYQTDVDVLQEFIDSSSVTINMDMDIDSSGVIEPLELCYQEWEDLRLSTLSCYDRGLSGNIPQDIGTLSNLRILDLHSNQLSGEIPESVGVLTNLNTLDLGMNQLSGEIPSEIGSLINLSKLYLYENQLSGQIPPEIWGLVNLTRLSLNVNNLSGIIPSEIGG